jgi:toxin-antitoxin system PIN domain toxin
MNKARRYSAAAPLGASRVAESVPWAQPLSGDLPDVNVWLALAVQEHPHHGRARAYWAEASGQTPEARLWFCRVTMLGLLRLLCQPKMGKGALSAAAAWKLYQRFRAVPGIALLAEPAQTEAQLHEFATHGALPPRLWTDAYLAAVARAGGLRLVTFDHGFQRFALPACLVLEGN